ncbi:MAG: BON domain-containing protein [Burkholderiaceae bacterium]
MNFKHLTRAILVLAFSALLAACAGTATQESTGEYIDDTVITSRVKSVLLNDPAVSGLSINVETYKGTVQLSGFVKTVTERNRAVQLARDVKGVGKVRNDILIR